MLYGVPSNYSKCRSAMQGTQVSQEAGDADINKPAPTPRSFSFYLKPVVRWATIALAAFALTWTMLGHVAAQRAQREQEASHQRYWSDNRGTQSLMCFLQTGSAWRFVLCEPCYKQPTCL